MHWRPGAELSWRETPRGRLVLREHKDVAPDLGVVRHNDDDIKAFLTMSVLAKWNVQGHGKFFFLMLHSINGSVKRV